MATTIDATTKFAFWLSYMLPLYPFCPAIGNIADGDCIVGLAFSRVQYTEEEVGSVIAGLRRMTGNVDADTFSLLETREFEEGIANIHLASHCQAYGYTQDPELLFQGAMIRRPIAAQWEILYSLWRRNPPWYEQNRNNLIALWPPESGPNQTPHVLEAAMKAMRARGLNRPVLVAAPVMLPRAVAMAWKMNIDVVVPEINMDIWATVVPESSQPWTRHFIWPDPRACWLPRETFGRWIYAPMKGLVKFTPPK